MKPDWRVKVGPVSPMPTTPEDISWPGGLAGLATRELVKPFKQWACSIGHAPVLLCSYSYSAVGVAVPQLSV